MKSLFLLVLALVLVGCGKNGKDGLNGSQGIAGISIQGPIGQNGSNGHNSIISMVTATTAQCSTGGTVIVSATDNNNDGIVESTDSNIQTSIICNGQVGAVGQTGATGSSAPPTPFTPVNYITPCGPNSSPYKEVLLVLEDGNILADFSDTVSGYNTRLAFMPDGTYQDTDSSACVFTVSTNGHTRTVSWSGGNQSWTF